MVASLNSPAEQDIDGERRRALFVAYAHIGEVRGCNIPASRRRKSSGISAYIWFCKRPRPS